MRAKGEKAKQDKIWKEAVRARDKVCQMCPSDKLNKVLNAHHIIPREFQDYRWDINNGILLCVHHHKFGKFSAHKNAVWFLWWLSKHRQETWDWVSRIIIDKISRGKLE